MKTGIFLSYRGLGANLLHLSYCHEIAKKFGPVTLITLNPKVAEVLSDDESFSEIIYLENYYKKFTHIYKLSNYLKKFNFENFFIFYPSIRYFLSSKLAGIPNIYHYPLFKKKGLHLVNVAKEFIQKNLKIDNCPTESKIILKKNKLENLKKDGIKRIILGIGSSGPTTKWGYENYISLIKKLNKLGTYHFYLLCGSNEDAHAKNIIKEVGKSNCETLSQKRIFEIKDYIAISDIYIGNDSFGHHIASQLGIPSFVILLDTPRAYSDYSVNHKRIIPPDKSLDDITHDSRLNPNSITVELVLDKIKNFI